MCTASWTWERKKDGAWQLRHNSALLLCTFLREQNNLVELTSSYMSILGFLKAAQRTSETTNEITSGTNVRPKFVTFLLVQHQSKRVGGEILWCKTPINHPPVCSFPVLFLFASCSLSGDKNRFRATNKNYIPHDYLVTSLFSFLLSFFFGHGAWFLFFLAIMMRRNVSHCAPF